jgi:prepilin-type N-terminal cleavage/methylation domain-containing protein
MLKKTKKGFTLIELLVVIAIIGILAGTVVISSIKGAARSRDARRVQELYQITHGLLLYYTTYDHFPDTPDADVGCNFYGISWDEGNEVVGPDDPFIKPLSDEGFLSRVPKEWTGSQVNGKSCVYRYAKVQNPCDGQCPGNYAILYAACETDKCPVGERPSCCDGSSWTEGAGADDPYDITIFLKEK